MSVLFRINYLVLSDLSLYYIKKSHKVPFFSQFSNCVENGLKTALISRV